MWVFVSCHFCIVDFKATLYRVHGLGTVTKGYLKSSCQNLSCWKSQFTAYMNMQHNRCCFWSGTACDNSHLHQYRNEVNHFSAFIMHRRWAYGFVETIKLTFWLLMVRCLKRIKKDLCFCLTFLDREPRNIVIYTYNTHIYSRDCKQ